MYDMLTLNELYALHTDLHTQTTALHATIMDADYNPIMSALSPEWAVVAAKCDEIHETMTEVYAEIGRREQDASEEAVINQSVYRALGGTDA